MVPVYLWWKRGKRKVKEDRDVKIHPDDLCVKIPRPSSSIDDHNGSWGLDFKIGPWANINVASFKDLSTHQPQQQVVASVKV